LGGDPDDRRHGGHDRDGMNAYKLTYRGSSLALALVAAAWVAACGQSGDKSGATADRQVTLRLSMPDQSDKLGTAFANGVVERSGGSVRIEIGRGYSDELPANELRLARALEEGRAEIGYLPARAWSAAGIPAFKALHAPFAITTDEATQALASGPIARTLLDALPDSVVGVALVPAEPRRILAVRAPLSPAAFRGLRLRIFDDPQSAAAIEALGATPIQGMLGDDAFTALRDGRIDGAESAPKFILTQGYWNHARHLSGYGVFPKFESIVVSRAAWERLSAEQQAAVRKAAEETVRTASATVAAQERSGLRQLCAAGTEITVPTPAQLRELAAAAEPAAAPLESDETATDILAAIRELPGAGPQPLTAPLPPECAARASSNRREARNAPTTIPDGVYVVNVTAEQFRAAGAVGPQVEDDITFTTRYRDGRWTQTQSPTFPDQCADDPTPSHPACSGTFRVDGDEVTFVWSKATIPPVPAPATFKWSYFDRVLRFKPVAVPEPTDLAIYGQPWRRIR
jgi:TRAP-type C4-dicarboxylate transport system substrate-binding protein